MSNRKNKRPISKITIFFCIVIIIIAIIIFFVLANGNKVDTSPIDRNNNTGNGTSFDENNISTVEATLEKPANIGDYIGIKLYGVIIDEENNKKINNYNDAYIKISKITKGTNNIKPYIDKYNKINLNNKIDFYSLKNTEEFVLLEYEIYLPQNFKSDEDITNINLKIKNVSNNGEDTIKLNDVEYNSTYAIITSEPLKENSILPGNVIKFTAIITMSQYLDSNDYLFAIEYTDNGEIKYKYVKGNV